MIQRIFISTIVLLTSFSAFGDSFSAYQIPTTRNGIEGKSLVFNFWNGEYPGPVIDVTKKITVEGYKSIRVLNEVNKCTIKKGLYHPWSTTGNSIKTYYTITDIFSYKANVAVVGEQISENSSSSESTIDVAAGEVITNVYYVSEGWCGGTLIRDGEQIAIDFSCDVVMDSASFTSTGADPITSSFNEQWMYLQCLEGHKAFVRDQALLAYPKVKLGKFKDYGSVGSR